MHFLFKFIIYSAFHQEISYGEVSYRLEYALSHFKDPLSHFKDGYFSMKEVLSRFKVALSYIKDTLYHFKDALSRFSGMNIKR